MDPCCLWDAFSHPLPVAEGSSLQCCRDASLQGEAPAVAECVRRSGDGWGRQRWSTCFAGVGVHPLLPVGEVVDSQTDTTLGGKWLESNHFLSLPVAFTLRTEPGCLVWHRCDLTVLNFCSLSRTCATEPSGSHLILLSTLIRDKQSLFLVS